jgi:hypothetical protein
MHPIGETSCLQLCPALQSIHFVVDNSKHQRCQARAAGFDETRKLEDGSETITNDTELKPNLADPLDNLHLLTHASKPTLGWLRIVIRWISLHY